MSSFIQDDRIVYKDYIVSTTSNIKGTILVNNGSYYTNLPVGSDNRLLTTNIAYSGTKIQWDSIYSFGTPIVITNTGNPQINGGKFVDPANTNVGKIGTTAYGGFNGGWGTSFDRVGIFIPINTSLRYYTMRGRNNSTDFVSNFSNVTGGFLEFTLGYIDQNQIVNEANWTAYSGGPHFVVDSSFWDVNPNKPIIMNNLNIPILEGHMVWWKVFNNYTGSDFSFPGDVLASSVFY